MAAIHEMAGLMLKTAGRTLALLGLLQARREWSGALLRSRLEVSERTLRRDIENLRQLGYGIDSVPGVGGGYRLGPGASIPPLVLTSDEAVAIAIGLRTAAVSAVTGIEDAAAGALAKLEQSLSSTTRHRIATVENAMVPLGRSANAVDMDAVVAVAGAIRESRQMRVDYRSHDGTATRRTIEPHRIVHTTHRWYVVAWDTARDDWRTLRLDRLTPRLPLAGRFTPRAIGDGELRTFITRSISASPYRYGCRVLMRASVGDVERRFGPTVATIVDLGDGTCELTTGSNSLEDLALYLGTSGIDFEVLDGDALRTALRSLAVRFARAADPDS
jgi:predicted DNA-binding transcriptional regulator YafY